MPVAVNFTHSQDPPGVTTIPVADIELFNNGKVYLCLSVISCHCDIAIIIILIKCYLIFGVLLYFVQ